MLAEQRSVYRNEEAAARLEQLGLTVDLLVNVVRQGEAARASATSLDPPTAPGYFAWSRRVRALREGTTLLGWSSTDLKNCPLAISPDGRMRIVVKTGNAATGTGAAASNKNRLGPVLENAVDDNQLDLFAVPRPSAHEPPETWMFLTHTTEGRARAELSLAATVHDGFVVLWREQIIVPDVELDSGANAERRGDDLDFTEEIDVPVARR